MKLPSWNFNKLYMKSEDYGRVGEKGVIYVITRGIEQYCNIVSNDYGVLIG